MTFLTLGAGPPVHLSLRSKTTSVPATQLDDFIGAATDRVLLYVVEAPRIFLSRIFFHQLGIENARHDHGEIGDGEPVLAGKVDTHSVVIDNHELFGFCERTRGHLECGKATDGHRAIKRPFDVFGCDRGAVLEDSILFQFESDGHVAELHVVGELHLELVFVVVGLPVRSGLHFVADQPVVAIPRHLVAGHVGADAMDVQIVRPAFGDDQQGLLARLRFGWREDSGRGEGGACGECRF